MIERPILFSAPMVKAILENRKTQTRRVVKFSKPFTHSDWPTMFRTDDGLWGWCDGDKPLHQMLSRPGKPCPYGQVGDRLWVKETWQDYCPLWEGAWCGCGSKEMIAKTHKVAYKATNTGIGPENIMPLNWKPSIFMPRWASRIPLEITGIKVERLQDITHEDAIAEGAEYMPAADLRKERLTVPQIVFAGYWDSINGKTHPWKSNPWVWRIEFKNVS